MGSLQQVIHFSKSALYNLWWPDIEQSHETFKTASPHGDQALSIKRQAFGVFQKKTVNTKNGSNYWRPPLHQTCLSKASFLVANRIGKAKKPFTIEELILPAAKDICYEFLEEVAVETVAHFLFWLAP